MFVSDEVVEFELKKKNQERIHEKKRQEWMFAA